MHQHFIIACFSIALLVCIIISSPTSAYWVKHSGDRSAMFEQQDVSRSITLKSLEGIPHLYAIGPIEGLRGEVTIYDGNTSLAYMQYGAPALSRQLKGGAVFLAYASVPEWVAYPIPSELEGLQAIERFIHAHLHNQNISPDQTLPFRIEGRAASLTYHIIFKEGDHHPHDKAAHQRAKQRFVLKEEPVRMIGFWVEPHQTGRLTHPGKRTHIHMQGTQSQASGHVERVTLYPGATLYLPRAILTQTP